MSRFCKSKKNVGAIVAAIGVGVVLTVVVPIWGWVIVVGGALIYGGWKIMGHHHD